MGRRRKTDATLCPFSNGKVPVIAAARGAPVKLMIYWTAKPLD